MVRFSKTEVRDNNRHDMDRALNGGSFGNCKQLFAWLCPPRSCSTAVGLDVKAACCASHQPVRTLHENLLIAGTTPYIELIKRYTRMNYGCNMTACFLGRGNIFLSSFPHESTISLVSLWEHCKHALKRTQLTCVMFGWRYCHDFLFV